MKRSEINKEIKFHLKVMEENNIHLPDIAYFDKNDWLEHREEKRMAMENGMGWDVTDYGHGKWDGMGCH
jgi:D-lyxose ketol-isomerase